MVAEDEATSLLTHAAEKVGGGGLDGRRGQLGIAEGEHLLDDGEVVAEQFAVAAEQEQRGVGELRDGGQGEDGLHHLHHRKQKTPRRGHPDAAPHRARRGAGARRGVPRCASSASAGPPAPAGATRWERGRETTCEAAWRKSSRK